MTSADHLSHPETPFPGKLSDHRCPACEALYRDTEKWTQKLKAATEYADAMEQLARAEEAKYHRLLRQISSHQQEEA